MPVRLFVAGATGATGQVFLPMATAAGFDLRVHVRPRTAARTPLARDPRARVFDLGDAQALAQALEGRDAVLSLVGTMRSRFAQGDTYESADVASTRQLVDGARAAGVPRFALLSSVGAGGPGAYLKMKGECERIVTESGLGWDIFRPSALVSPPDAPEGTHGRREVPGFLVAAGAALARLPGVGPVVDDWRPIPISTLCAAMIRVLGGPATGRVLHGRDLFRLARTG